MQILINFLKIDNFRSKQPKLISELFSKLGKEHDYLQKFLGNLSIWLLSTILKSAITSTHSLITSPRLHVATKICTVHSSSEHSAVQYCPKASPSSIVLGKSANHFSQVSKADYTLLGRHEFRGGTVK